MHEKILLQTEAGELVSEEFILPMNKPPEVILWGSRCFVRFRHTEKPTKANAEADENTTIYREGLMIPIPTPRFYLTLGQG